MRGVPHPNRIAPKGRSGGCAAHLRWVTAPELSCGSDKGGDVTNQAFGLTGDAW